MSLNQKLGTVVGHLGRLRTNANNAGSGLSTLQRNAGSAAGAVGRIQSSANNANTSVGRLRTTANNAGSGLGSLQRNSGTASGAVNRVRTSANQANTSIGRLRTTSNSAGTSIGRIRTASTNSASAVGRLNTGVRGANTSLGQARTGSDRFRSSLDRLRSSANRARTALRGVKTQADAVEKSVGNAGKNADRGDKAMGNFSRGARGASVAQRGLNLVMAANPLGLIMALLAPLILKFVDLEKIGKAVMSGLRSAFKGISDAASAAGRFLGPLLKDIGNMMLFPTRMVVTGLNILIGAMNKIKFSVPDWVPVIGGKKFGFSIPTIPVPKLAEGGIVQPRSGGTLALVAEAGEAEAVIPLSKLGGMMGSGPELRRLAVAVEKLADRPVLVKVDSQTIARAVFMGQRQLARR
ncbi:hypothetical protein GCM10010387_04610 [Streptomyces inusitatus]|uniref:Phage tail protein n=1 Tax=Streptomyces inusitatus TaxID=68221 RepID=A0A918PN11_9ACTN|nr:hypothetical protein [Streptomyces inusitatus]GGZ15364.1 hypothetical protein GCM10010387_04610 [Streptomyces inusitatus]